MAGDGGGGEGGVWGRENGWLRAKGLEFFWGGGLKGTCVFGEREHLEVNGLAQHMELLLLGMEGGLSNRAHIQPGVGHVCVGICDREGGGAARAAVRVRGAARMGHGWAVASGAGHACPHIHLQTQANFALVETLKLCQPCHALLVHELLDALCNAQLHRVVREHGPGFKACSGWGSTTMDSGGGWKG